MMGQLTTTEVAQMAVWTEVGLFDKKGLQLQWRSDMDVPEGLTDFSVHITTDNGQYLAILERDGDGVRPYVSHSIKLVVEYCYYWISRQHNTVPVDQQSWADAALLANTVLKNEEVVDAV